MAVPKAAMLPVTIEAATAADARRAGDRSMRRPSEGGLASPPSRSNSTVRAFICAVASTPRRCAVCSTCWRNDDRFAARVRGCGWRPA